MLRFLFSHLSYKPHCGLPVCIFKNTATLSIPSPLPFLSVRAGSETVVECQQLRKRGQPASQAVTKSPEGQCQWRALCQGLECCCSSRKCRPPYIMQGKSKSFCLLSKATQIWTQKIRGKDIKSAHFASACLSIERDEVLAETRELTRHTCSSPREC